MKIEVDYVSDAFVLRMTSDKSTLGTYITGPEPDEVLDFIYFNNVQHFDYGYGIMTNCDAFDAFLACAQRNEVAV